MTKFELQNYIVKQYKLHPSSISILDYNNDNTIPIGTVKLIYHISRQLFPDFIESPLYDPDSLVYQLVKPIGIKFDIEVNFS